MSRLDDLSSEHRMYPRFKGRLLACSGDGIPGKILDISPGGVCFSTAVPPKERELSMGGILSGEEISFELAIKWIEKNENGEGYLCGGQITSISDENLTLIAKYMIREQFRALTADVRDKGAREEILRFAKSFRDYLLEQESIRRDLERGKSPSEDIFQRIKRLNDDIVDKGDRLKEKLRDDALITTVKDLFRSLVGSWAYTSQIMYRGFSKPKGYPGDYETLELIYDECTVSPEGTLGYFFDRYFLSNPYAEAVRKRKDKLRELLERAIREGKERMEILNLACGACREIRELCHDDHGLTDRKVVFNCLDWDKEALGFSKKKLRDAPSNFEFNFIEKNMLHFIRKSDFYEKKGNQDLIYSIGLADYCTDRLLKTMIRNAFSGLRKGGRFIIAHKDKDIHFSHLPPEWFCDWMFVSRNEEDMLALIDDIGLQGAEVSVERDDTGEIFFITLQRP